MKRKIRADVLGAALLILFGSAHTASASSFEKSPRQYDALANRALAQVGSDLHFTLGACANGKIAECHFSSKHITVLVLGRFQPPRTEKIILEADLLQDGPGADPVTVITHVVLALGATVVVFDPQLSAERRVQLLSDLTNTALEKGRSEATGLNAQYSATFEEADGMITVTVLPTR